MELKNGMDLVNEYFGGFDKEIPYVTFSIYLQDFGIEAANVREVIHYAKPLKVPKTIRCLEGVLNVRGEMIPVFDLRKMLGLAMANIDEWTVIIIVESKGKSFGLIADRILDFINLPESSIRPQPDIIVKYVRAIGTIGEKQIFLLDTDQVIGQDPSGESIFGRMRETA